MGNSELNVPVAFIIFNRPETTLKVFQAIREAKPKQLFIIADGPRANISGEEQKCLEARTIIENVDWDCKVYKNYSKNNLGCRKRVSSGMDWLFENVEEAIILEDDCLPHISFFKYCETLLEQYKNNDNVMMISGDRLVDKTKLPSTSYYFSKYPHIWGWATWKRAWQFYDVEMKDWGKMNKQNFLRKFTSKKRTANYWHFLFDETFEGAINTWDYQWLFYCMLNNGVVIIPTVNLVSNIGFGINSTHTSDIDGFGSQIPLEEMIFPMIHPEKIHTNKVVDVYEEQLYYKLTGKNKIKFYLKLIGLRFLFSKR